VAILDIDHLKDVNDSAGHDTGDEMLIRVAAALAGFACTEDILARIGGDEFAWILPHTMRQKELVAVERARRLVAEAPADPLAITISAGICDTDTTSDPGELLRLADSALYWSKEHGRNQAWIYDPAVVQELSEHQRAARIERAQALEGLRALVREREGRDPARSGHSERVASTAVTLATRLGWPRERAMLLGEAAMLHDIGPAARGEAPARLDGQIGEPELERLRAAAQASARVLDGLLSAEQVAWIADQFAFASRSSDGGALVALADVWDLGTAVAPGGPAAAGASRRLADRGFVRGIRLQYGPRADGSAGPALPAARHRMGAGGAADLRCRECRLGRRSRDRCRGGRRSGLRRRRQRQLALIANAATALPYYWAAFTLIGDGGAPSHTASDTVPAGKIASAEKP